MVSRGKLYALVVTVLVALVATGGGAVAQAAAPVPGPRSAPLASGRPLTPAAAAAAVRALGYTPTDTAGYDPDHDLSVIVGSLSSAVDGHPQEAFLFHRGRLIGPAAAPSAGVRWLWSTGDTVALGYDLYRPDDPLCCASGGASTVRFHWTGHHVGAEDPLPPTSWSAPLSRRG
jgi:hypothetical protein